MKIRLKWIIASEALVILLLLAFIISLEAGKAKTIQSAAAINPNGLLSPRVYSGLLKPQSFLITNFDPLKEKLKDYIKQHDLNVSVYVENLRNGAQMGINEHIGLYPASLNKIPVAILVMDKIEKGKLSLDTVLQINDSDKNDPTSDFYKSNGSKASVQVLINKMLKESDNTAFYTLLRNIDRRDLERLLSYYDLDPRATYSLNGMSGQELNSRLITPLALSNIFSSLYLSTVLKPNSSEYILYLLTDDLFDIKKIANLPDNVKVAQKFGAYYGNGLRYFHDCGIIYSGETRILFCIMTKDMDEPVAIGNIGLFVHSIYSYTNYTREQLDVFRSEASISLPS